MRRGRAAPAYWATKVATYPAIPMKKAMNVKAIRPAGPAAAMASTE